MKYTYTINGIIDENGNPAPDGSYVITWDDNEVTDGPLPLSLARRYCRGSGHTGEIVNGRYVPIAFVANEHGELVYNPRFMTSISPIVGSLVNTNDDCLRA